MTDLTSRKGHDCNQLHFKGRKLNRLIDNARANAGWLEHQGFHSPAGAIRELVDVIEQLIIEVNQAKGK